LNEIIVNPIKHMTMELWYIWVSAALLLFIIELFTTGFAVICLSFGALGGAVAALVGWNLELQFVAFAITSFVAIIAVRPLLKRLFFKEGEKVLTNANAIIGKRGVVCVDVDRDDAGRVMIDGMDWRAKSVDDEPLPKGTKVEVVDMDSIVLIIKKL
jgi:membrane protein implicated in regulation of membrane protease activity